MKTKFVVDRLEGEHAVLLTEEGDRTVDYPIKLLPNGVKEGDLLLVDISIDEEGKEKRRTLLNSMIKRLKGDG